MFLEASKSLLSVASCKKKYHKHFINLFNLYGLLLRSLFKRSESITLLDKKNLSIDVAVNDRS